jgi:hypothetical protein
VHGFLAHRDELGRRRRVDPVERCRRPIEHACEDRCAPRS